MYFLFVWATLLCLGACASVRNESCGIQFPGYSCGLIQVPLDYERPSGLKLDFHFARLQPNVTTGSTPLVLLTGGPGLALISALDASTLTILSSLRRPILAVDYRGIGRSDVLECRTLQNVNTSFPVTSVQSEICITEIGPETRYYDSVTISRDIDMLRRTLNFTKIDLYGASYGTFVLQTYAALFPTTVRAAVLDSPVPLKFDVYGRNIWGAFARIYNVRDGVDSSKLLRNLATILGLLRGSSALRRRTKVTPEQLALVYRIADRRLPKALDVAVRTSNYSLLSIVAEDVTGPTLVGPATFFSNAASISINCNDVVRLVPWGRTDPAGARRTKANKAISGLANDTFSPFLPHEAFERPTIVRCSGFPFAQKLPPVLKAPNMGVFETFTLYGEEDQATPIENMPDLDAVYKTRLVVIPKVGHVVLVNNLCSAGLIAEFLATLNVANVTGCS